MCIFVKMDVSKAFESDFRTYYRPLCLYALHYLGDPDVVEDVVQESFLALWRQETPVTRVKSWLYSAVRNRSIDMLRRAGKTESLPSPERHTRQTRPQDVLGHKT